MLQVLSSAARIAHPPLVDHGGSEVVAQMSFSARLLLYTDAFEQYVGPPSYRHLEGVVDRTKGQLKLVEGASCWLRCLPVLALHGLALLQTSDTRPEVVPRR